MDTNDKKQSYNIAEALLVVGLALAIRGHKHAIWEAAKRIKNRCDPEARNFVVDYVLKTNDPVKLVKVALGELELFYTKDQSENQAA